MKKITSCIAILAILAVWMITTQSTRASASEAWVNIGVNNGMNQTCQTILTQAMSMLEHSCNTVERNRACYGNNNIKATLRTTDLAKFSQPGDKLPLQVIQSLITMPFNETEGTWGLSLLKLQANLPDTLPGQNVTFLMYGDTSVNNTSGDMRTFYFTTGLGTPSCNEVPNDGILVRSPNHMKVAFTANGVDITIASTILMRATPNQGMEITLIEGQAVVSTADGTVILEPGQKTGIPLGGSNGLQAVGAPSTPETTAFSAGEANLINLTTKLDAETDTKNAIATNTPPDTDDELVIEGCITNADGNTITVYGYEISLAGLPPENLGKGTCVSIKGKLKITPRGLEIAASNIMKIKPPEKLTADDAVKTNSSHAASDKNNKGTDKSNNSNNRDNAPGQTKEDNPNKGKAQK